MASYLLDTDALIDYLKAKPATVALVDGLHRDGHVLAICCINVTELYAGLTEREKEEAAEVVSAFRYLDVSREAAIRAGRYQYYYARKGIQLHATDSIIAATALEHNATLVTGNTAHYPMQEITLLRRP